MKVPFVDIAAQTHEVSEEIEEALRRVLKSGQYILGPEVSALESELAAYLGLGDGKEVVGVSSGTDALLMCMMHAGIGPGDEVILPDFGYFAAAECVVRLGATCVFADVGPDFQISVQSVAGLISPATRMVVAIDLFGDLPDWKGLRALAERHGFLLVEDAAQAIGSSLEGRMAGGFGDMATFSFFPTKNLGAAGDGGAIVCGTEVAREIRSMRSHGTGTHKYEHVRVGGNFRLDALQAAILRAKLPHLDRWNARRREVADYYDECLDGLGIGLPKPKAESNWHQYTITLAKRDEVRAALSQRGIETQVYYPLQSSEQPLLKGSRTGDLGVSARLHRLVLSLPLAQEGATYVARALEELVQPERAR
jgi:dTDP-4-amino-4,6-dideoxygalactose transaminase